MVIFADESVVWNGYLQLTGECDQHKCDTLTWGQLGKSALPRKRLTVGDGSQITRNNDGHHCWAWVLAVRQPRAGWGVVNDWEWPPWASSGYYQQTKKHNDPNFSPFLLRAHNEGLWICFNTDLNNTTPTNFKDIFFNIVSLWLNTPDLPPRQCIFTLTVEGRSRAPCRTSPQPTLAHCH